MKMLLLNLLDSVVLGASTFVFFQTIFGKNESEKNFSKEPI